MKSHTDVSRKVSLQMDPTDFNKKGPQIMGNEMTFSRWCTGERHRLRWKHMSAYSDILSNGIVSVSILTNTIGSPYLCLFLIRIHVFFWLRVAVCLLHADQLELEVRHFVYQIKFLSLQRGPTHQLLGKTQAVSCGNLHVNNMKAHLRQSYARSMQRGRTMIVHSQQCFFPTARDKPGGPDPTKLNIYTLTHIHGPVQGAINK